MRSEATRGRIRKRQGSSAPFQSAIALAEGSASSVPTTWRSSDSRQPPGRSCANALKFTQVESPCDAAARFSAIVRARSSAVQPPAGPTLSTFTPAAATSANPSAGGPFANAIGKTFRPSSTTVPCRSSRVVAAAAGWQSASASSGRSKRLIAA